MKTTVSSFDVRQLSENQTYHGNWPMFGGYAENTNRSELAMEAYPLHARHVDDLACVATFSFPNGTSRNENDGFVVVGNFLYVLTGNLIPTVQKIDLVTKELVWENKVLRTSFEPTIGRRLLAYQGVKLFVSVGNEVCVLDTKTGYRLRTVTIDSGVNYIRIRLNRLFVGTSRKIHFYDTDTWRYLGNAPFVSPIGDFSLSASEICVVDASHFLYVYDHFNNKVVTTSYIPFSNEDVLTPVVSDNGVYVSTSSGRLTRNTFTGHVAWTSEPVPEILSVSSMAVGYERVYIVSSSGTLRCISIFGQEKFVKDYSDTLKGKPQLMLTSRMVCVYDDATLLITDSQSGELLKHVRSPISLTAVIPIGNRSLLGLGHDCVTIFSAK